MSEKKIRRLVDYYICHVKSKDKNIGFENIKVWDCDTKTEARKYASDFGKVIRIDVIYQD